MKRVLLIILFLVGGAISQSSRPRFERILLEEHDHSTYFVVIHDKETGQEVVCYKSGVDLGFAPSCWLTGRNWK